MSRRVLVVGGGLAGIAAALAAADGGAEVTLLEARPRLGGATVSFPRELPGGDVWVDNGQHVFLRCCTAYRGLLSRLGVEHLTRLQDRLDVPVLLAGCPGEPVPARLRRTRWPVPAPLHLTGAMLGYRALPLRERLAAGVAAGLLGRLDPRSPAVDGQSFGGWLGRHRQGPAATEALWELLTVATLNLPAPDASLGLAAKVVRTGLLESASAGDIGWSEVPLQRLHGDAAATALAGAGARVRTGVKVGGLVRTATGGWEARTPDGPVTADAVVVALPPAAAAGLVPSGAPSTPIRPEALGTSPIVNVHVLFDRTVLAEPFVAAVGSPLQWVFDRTASSGLRRGQYLAISVSAADEWIGRPVGELKSVFVEELRRVLPAARSARVVGFLVTRERTATFRQAPGSLALRPAQRTALPGLALAGAWTDTDWPATMEGAVRSGIAAVTAVADDLALLRRATGHPATGPVAVLPEPARPARPTTPTGTPTGNAEGTAGVGAAGRGAE